MKKNKQNKKQKNKTKQNKKTKQSKTKRAKRKIDAFRKKLMIPNCELAECPECKVKLKIGNIFVDEKILEEYSVKIYEIDPYFYELYRKKNAS